MSQIVSNFKYQIIASNFSLGKVFSLFNLTSEFRIQNSEFCEMVLPSDNRKDLATNILAYLRIPNSVGYQQVMSKIAQPQIINQIKEILDNNVNNSNRNQR